MDQDQSKSVMTAIIFEHSCKTNLEPVINKILHDDQLSSSLAPNFACEKTDHEKVKPVFLLVAILQKMLSAVKSFSSETGVNSSWNSANLSTTLRHLERAYEQCEYISLKKFFSLITQLKFLDLMNLLSQDVEALNLLQKLNLHFPRWQANQKENIEKQFCIENSVILVKVEESYTQCRKLIMKLAADSSYRSHYMSRQFSSDLQKMKQESALYLKEVITNLLSNAGDTVIDKIFLNQRAPAYSDNLAFQLLLDYIRPEASSENLIQFLDEMESVLSPPTGGFSSCLLPFDTISECSEAPMDLDSEEGGSESCSEED